MYDNVLFTRCLSQVHLISERANTIASMDENSGIYLLWQVHLSDAEVGTEH